eukprot:97454-Pleurochrysis_carterae.AAC.1
MYVTAPPDLLRRPQVGDYLVIAPPASKADKFGVVWSGNPIYLHYMQHTPLDAFSAVADIFLRFEAPPEAPLFTDAEGRAWTASFADTLLSRLLLRFLPPARAAHYSWHSFRVYLACALLESGASPAQIQALCRWQSDESLKVYARLTPAAYGDLLEKAMRARLHAVRTNHVLHGLP